MGKTKVSLNKHVTKKHISIVCPFCSKICFGEHDSLKHIAEKHSQMKFFCTKCKLQFCSKYNLGRHLVNQHKIENKIPFDCVFCQKRFRKEFLLTQHEKICFSHCAYSKEKGCKIQNTVKKLKCTDDHKNKRNQRVGASTSATSGNQNSTRPNTNFQDQIQQEDVENAI